jgi:succinyl-CoA synthetase beta subunit
MMMDEDNAKDLLEQYGIRRPPHFVIRGERTGALDIESLSEAGVRYPVVAKVLGDDIAHKTELGAVRVGIRTPEELMDVLRDFVRGFPRMDVLVEEYVPHGPEFILGLAEDPAFGPVVVFGAGGTLTEIYGDVAFRRLPITEEGARELISATRIGKVLTGYRGMRLREEAVLRAIVAISKLAEERHGDISELEVNPLICVGDDAVALDAKIVRRAHGQVGDALPAPSKGPTPAGAMDS